MLWDISFGPEYDLTRAPAQRLLLGWIRAGQVIGLHMGTPCTSFSRIRGLGAGPGRLRSTNEPLGLGTLERPEDKAALDIGNKLLTVSCRLFLACIHACVPVSLENPATSILWLTPQIQNLQRRRIVHLVTPEFCMWGKAWRKSTKFLYCHVDLAALGERRCLGAPRGCCARTGHCHIRLFGRSPGGQFWTKVAEPYPNPLCNQICACFANSVVRSRSSRFSKFING